MNAQPLLTRVDAQEQILFSSQAITRLDDQTIQRLMGIEVHMRQVGDVVGPRPHGLAEGELSPALASRLFTVLCGYRVVDVLSLLSGAYPTATVVERSQLPTTGLLPVRCALYISALPFTTSHSITSL